MNFNVYKFSGYKLHAERFENIAIAIDCLAAVLEMFSAFTASGKNYRYRGETKVAIAFSLHRI